jgi:hypothetical protein
VEDLEHQLRTALYERDYWMEQYHNKEMSKIINKLNEKLDLKDVEIKCLNEDIKKLENKLKVVPFKPKATAWFEE